jgi:hypothetical protein
LPAMGHRYDKYGAGQIAPIFEWAGEFESA